MAQERTVRNLLLALGIGEYQAQMVTPNMFQAPAVTDPKSPHVMIVVAAIQQKLAAAGYPLQVTGYLDPTTASTLDQVLGEGWERMTWADVITHVLAQSNTPGDYTAADTDRAPVPQDRVTFADIPSSLGLPDVPGGIITYGILGYLAYRYFTKKKASTP